MNDTLGRFRGCLLGLAVGDAVGTTVEFRPRGSFHPVVDMTGGGPFHLKPGQWTDDTSMALCLASSLTEVGFDLRDQIERYCCWFKDVYWSSTGVCFDIGTTVRRALADYRRSGDPISGSVDPKAAGNGCIMRLAPVPMFFFPDEDEAADHAARSCLTTHGATECLDAARLLSHVLVRALSGASKADLLAAAALGGFTSPAIAALATGAYVDKSESEIRGSGYVVESLEAALWCFHTTDSYERRCSRRQTWATTPTRRRRCAARSPAPSMGNVASRQHGWRGCTQWRRSARWRMPFISVRSTGAPCPQPNFPVTRTGWRPHVRSGARQS